METTNIPVINTRFIYTVKQMRKNQTMFICPIAVQVKSADNLNVELWPLERAVDIETGITVIDFDSKINIVPAYMGVFLSPYTHIEDLSNKFSELVTKYYTKKQLSEVNRLNATVDYSNGSCATQNYFDSNMIMDEAFTSVMGRDYVFFDDEFPETEKQHKYDTDITNQAWGLSRQRLFKTNK